MSFDPIAFITAASEMAPAVIFVVMALTYAAGLFGLSGKPQLALSMVLGGLGGGGLQVATTGVPNDFAGWFWLVIYALVLAVTPPLLYETWKKAQAKGIAELLAKFGLDQVAAPPDPPGEEPVWVNAPQPEADKYTRGPRGQ